MKVLLIGEYSRLHNSLKEGLISNGHQVCLVSNGDGFKNFPSDISIKPSTVNLPIIKTIKIIIYKLFKLNLNLLESGFRFWWHSSKFKGFDIVQLINEKSIATFPYIERLLLKKIIKNNRKIYLLSCGVDTFVVKHLLKQEPKYSILTPYFNDKTLKSKVQYILDYTKSSHFKTHQLVIENVSGIIASDFDYVLPLQGHPKFKGLIPNPINLSKITYKPLTISGKIIILLGINKWNSISKGVTFFESALRFIEKKYKDQVEILKVSNLPYLEYVKLYDKSHILLDQVYGYDQGYNALEAMARGKVVFTGAEDEFLNYYNLKEDQVCINALPNVERIIEKLTFLINNPSKILEIGKKARDFIEREHSHIEIAKKYTEIYKL